jgi:hypothetical protein
MNELIFKILLVTLKPLNLCYLNAMRKNLLQIQGKVVSLQK